MIWIQPGAADSAVYQFISANDMEDKVVFDGPEKLIAPTAATANPTLSSSSEGSVAPPLSLGLHSPSTRNQAGSTSGTSHVNGTSDPATSSVTHIASPSPEDPAPVKTPLTPQPDGGPCGAVTMLQSIIHQNAKSTSSPNKKSCKVASDSVSSPKWSTQLNSQTSLRIGLRMFGSKASNSRRAQASTPVFDGYSTEAFIVDKEFPGMP